jgi:hypothetical protein
LRKDRVEIPPDIDDEPVKERIRVTVPA